MECNRCKNKKDIEDFSYYMKNNNKIYYLSCNTCKNKSKNIKEKHKEEYENRKNNNIINCECGIKYIAFRDYHIYRHNISKKHCKIIYNE